MSKDSMAACAIYSLAQHLCCFLDEKPRKEINPLVKLLFKPKSVFKSRFFFHYIL